VLPVIGLERHGQVQHEHRERRMLEPLKRLFETPQGQGADLADITAWVGRRGYGIAPMEGGFAIDGSLDGTPWQLEWAPPQRPFIQAQELRMQIRTKSPADVHMMLMSLSLAKALEKQAFESFTQSVQTQVGEPALEELRWLVMFPKADLTGLLSLSQHYAAVASSPAQCRLWIEGALATLLQRAVGTLLAGDPPFVMMLTRGRVALRMQLSDVAPPFLGTAISLFEAAVARAPR
jgi:hypothetical protein